MRKGVHYIAVTCVLSLVLAQLQQWMSADHRLYQNSEDENNGIPITKKDSGTIVQTQTASTANVLKEAIKFAASDLDLDSFASQELFPPVGIVRHKKFECEYYPLDPEHKDELQSHWKNYVDKDQQKDRGCEFIQEMGFIHFFRSSYPRIFFVVGTDSDNGDAGASGATSPPTTIAPTTIAPTTIAPTTIMNSRESVKKVHYLQLRSFLEEAYNDKNLCFFFLPLCPFLQSEHKGKKLLRQVSKAMVPQLQAELHAHNIFHVAAHPILSEIQWEQSIRNIRRFQIDPTIVGSMSDVLVPVGTTPHNFDYSRDNDRDKVNLIYGCGAEHKYSRRYRGWRYGLFETLTKLNKTDIDASSNRTKEEYDSGFFQSKFCFVIPGDTIATSQASRAMAAGCVPVFVVADFRELPFSNVLDYSQFSIRMHGDDLLLNDHRHSMNDHEYENVLGFKVASDFYNRLQSMVTSGKYKQLLGNVRIARDFFNYHRFGSRSPYGLAMVSMYQNKIDERAY